ncbi:MAG: hypothetical protein ACI39U_03255, partial [Candidatus Cryptobacteroides sp.]
KVDAEEFIAKKGINAKGKKVSALDVKSVRFIEPLVKPEDEELPAEDDTVGDDGSEELAAEASAAPVMDQATDTEPTLF